MDHNPTTPLSADEADARARQLITEAYAPPTSHRDQTPLPAYGDTPPVAQPGRPPMSPKATDISALMLSGSVAALSVSGGVSLVLYTLGQVDPVALAIGAAGPVALVLAAGSLLKALARAKSASTTTTHHHHYTGSVSVRQETTLSSTTKGMIARANNTLGGR
ncbi:hypothetical protein ACIGD1_34450 [Streptomyces sp. NPDC085612]|uniref:hypothetical protein n=1 Tax=Streptomyces sp. NPDC085612 TaxID=3365732 RepID=UPI0037D88FEA